MNKGDFRKIYRLIKKYKTIVIARHVGADPDALCSQIALRDSIIAKFPGKKVYAVGCSVSRLKFLGNLDRFTDEMYQDSLLIILDVPDKKRIDGVDVEKFKESIKIDHHPFVESICTHEYIDNLASSTCQIIAELIFNTSLKLNTDIASKLYIGIIADTNRFMYYYTTYKTFTIVGRLIKETNLNFTTLYEPLYLKPIKEIRFQGYIASNLTINDSGFAYIKINDDVLDEYGIDAATACNMVGNFNYIEEIKAWVIFAYDKNSDFIRTSIRSRGPAINEIAVRYGGGGHIYASGVRFPNFEATQPFIEELDKICADYSKNNNEIR